MIFEECEQKQYDQEPTKTNPCPEKTLRPSRPSRIPANLSSVSIRAIRVPKNLRDLRVLRGYHQYFLTTAL